MNQIHCQSLIMTGLERAAEKIGDLTQPAYHRYYGEHPEMVEVHDFLFPDGRPALEGQMVHEVIKCIMEWFEDPDAVETALTVTIPHHLDTLDIRPDQFTDLVDVVCDLIVGTIPIEAGDELAAWEDLRRGLAEVFELGKSYSRTYG